MKKKDDSGPKIRRNEDGSLDNTHADEVLSDLTKKLITEERAYQKDISFKNARGQKRDVMVFITICQRNSVDGMVVLSDDEQKGFERWSERDPYRYKVYEYVECDIKSKEIPMDMGTAARFLSGCMHAMKNYLVRMNVINNV